MTQQVVTTGYQPRPHQAELHASLKRFNVLVCHRRFGKTVFCINEMLDQGIRCQLKNPQYAYIAPNYGQAKRVAWDYFKEYTRNIPGVVVNEAELRIDIPRPDRGDRIRFMLLGAENPGSLRGIYLDGAVLDEYAEMLPTTWSQVIRPALSDRIGWAIFIGTPKGMNHFHAVYEFAQRDPDWRAAMYRASETGVIPQSELDAAKREMSDEEYEQEYECSFAAALVGAFFGKQMEKIEKAGQITKVPHDPSYGVSTWWDLGLDDCTAVWFIQDAGLSHKVINYLEDRDYDMPHYAKILKELPYSYNSHNLPHDAKQRDFGTKKSRVDTLKGHGLTNIIVHPKFRVEDQINATRLILPKCWFDREATPKGVNALKNYVKQWDERNKTYLQTPKHNWASHGADAFKLFGMAHREQRIDSRNLPAYANSDYDPFAM